MDGQSELGYEAAKTALEEIRSAVSPGFEEEANSILESIIVLDATEQEKAQQGLMQIYNVMLAPIAKNGQPQGEQSQPMSPETQPMEPMEPIMSEKNPEGIIRYNLTDHVAEDRKMVKTAADQFGQQYLLYGPTEKRICPKLRGKNLSVGDVVSEFTCRHHCIDGICIDDNKTICGEALWRANAMDKYSREYVDTDGKIEGGYLNKRFEINRNTSEENRIRLKPGEVRKPRPASQGNLESRMQDMRNKEGKTRNYRPNTDTSKPFNWSKDVDQNNVEASQKERDRREEDSGHQSVQYTNREQGENNPKKMAFNLKPHKTAECPHPHETKIPSHEMVHNPAPSDRHQIEMNPSAGHAPAPADIDPRQQTTDHGKPMVGFRSTPTPEKISNLQELREAVSNRECPEDIQELCELEAPKIFSQLDEQYPVHVVGQAKKKFEDLVKHKMNTVSGHMGLAENKPFNLKRHAQKGETCQKGDCWSAKHTKEQNESKDCKKAQNVTLSAIASWVEDTSNIKSASTKKKT